VAFQSIASPTEHFLATSDPAELADYADDGHLVSADTAESSVDLGLGGQSRTLIDGDEFGSPSCDDDAQIELDIA
jgi:hypothetical protein